MASANTSEQGCNLAQPPGAVSLTEMVDNVMGETKAAEINAAKEPKKKADGPCLSEVLLQTLREMLEEQKAAKAKEKLEEAKRAAAGISVP